MKAEKAQLIVNGMKEAGVDFAAGVPDAQFIEVYKNARARCRASATSARRMKPRPRGFAWARGAAGRKPALVIATSGLLVATYHIARINLLHEIPLLILIPIAATGRPALARHVSKNDREPALKAMDVPYRVVRRPEDIVRTVKECHESARAWLRSTAVLFTEEALW
jgi:sulfopyruvate decarboxylase TPP-binding subunit